MRKTRVNIKKRTGDGKEGEMMIGKSVWRRKGGEEEKNIAFTSALQPGVDSVIFHTARYRSSLSWSEREDICCVLDGCRSWDLNGNNLTAITKADFSGLKHLRVLHLMENQIGNVERGAFDELKELERLRLNKNRLSHFPELLFQKNELLSRLDLSENAIQSIPRRAFRGATGLKNLQLDKNHISCIEEGAFRALRSLEVL
ncbi:hypothetical protein KUCAC02_019273, partial [Chaenocephalus aceratus]